jgi:hypothetical protein
VGKDEGTDDGMAEGIIDDTIAASSSSRYSVVVI